MDAALPRFWSTGSVYTFAGQAEGSSSSESTSPRSSIAGSSHIVIETEADGYESEVASASSRLLRTQSTDDAACLSARPSRAPSPLPGYSPTRPPLSTSVSWASTKEMADDDMLASEDEDGDDEGSSGSLSADSTPSHYAGLVAKLGFRPRVYDVKPRAKRHGPRKDHTTKSRSWLRPGRRKGQITLVADDDLGRGPKWLRSLWRIVITFIRHPCIPSTPVTLLFALILVASFAFSLTTFIIHVLDTDKEPLPWRSFCQDQRPFPHELANGLPPVDVFVGVFSVDAAYERRHLIRTTYARHTRPMDPVTGLPGTNVQLKFIVGRPRTRHARRVALEMELYNDVVVLDIKENMNNGKTYAYFKWAAENATVPIYYRQRSDDSDSPAAVAFKRADYVVKADDDSFLVLDEIERHLRITPREKTYWGYLIRELFMGGEVYAVSADLTDYISSYTPLESHTLGAEDKKVARWMRMHPNASAINWVTERCWIYDHPKAGTTYAHGFLFPDEVERIRAEGRRGLPESERDRRGGPEWSQSWSSVSSWRKEYSVPATGLSMEEESEALIEGGGRWRSDVGWKAQATYTTADQVRFDYADPKLIFALNLSSSDARLPKESWTAEPERTGRLRYNKFANDLLRDPDDLLATWQPTVVAHPSSAAPSSAPVSPPDDPHHHLVPLPTLRYDSAVAETRSDRMLGLAHGGTVAVHYLKRNEWFLETAVVLLGRAKMWDGGLDALAMARSMVTVPQAQPIWDGSAALELQPPVWGTARMYGSPILVPNGGPDVYVTEGRAPRLPPAPESPTSPIRSPPRFGYADPSQGPSFSFDLSSSAAMANTGGADVITSGKPSALRSL